MAKSASELLLDYGYTETSPGYFTPLRPSSEQWVKVNGGWECYGHPVSFGGGLLWGKQLDNGLVQMPYTQSEKYAGVSGLHPATHPEAFQWVWPEERLIEIYSHVPAPGESNPWRKTDTGEYVREE